MTSYKDPTEIINAIRKEELDCNNQASFFGSLIKAFIASLNDSIYIREKPVPHMIINTGDDLMWLAAKDYDIKDPVSNEDYIYNTIPRCIVTPGDINIQTDQLTTPYSRGIFQIENSGFLLDVNSEFRRMPLVINIGLKYILASFGDMLELVQQSISKLMFTRTFKFSYMGQVMYASYNIPTSISDQHITELAGDTQDPKVHTIELTIEIECGMPVYEPKTATLNKYIARTPNNLHIKGPVIADNVHREATDVPGYRGHNTRI